MDYDIFDTDTATQVEPDLRLRRILRDVKRYIDSHYEPPMLYSEEEPLECSGFTDDEFESMSYSCDPSDISVSLSAKSDMDECRMTRFSSRAQRSELWDSRTPHRPRSLADMLGNMDKSFSDTLFDYIDKKGLKDSEAYQRSNIDRRTFSKIKCDRQYKPSKITALSFVIGLRLNLEEATHLLSTAGLCLSHSSRFDVIVEYFIVSSSYTKIDDVNATLEEFGESILGYVAKDDLYARRH